MDELSHDSGDGAVPEEMVSGVETPPLHISALSSSGEGGGAKLGDLEQNLRFYVAQAQVARRARDEEAVSLLEALIGITRRRMQDLDTRAGSGIELVKRNITVGGARTSLKLEGDVWEAVDELASLRQMRWQDVCQQAFAGVPEQKRAAAVRVFALNSFRKTSVPRNG